MKKNKINKGSFTLDIFLDYGYVSSYLQTKTFTWKRDLVITS